MNFEDMPVDEKFFAGFDKRVLKVRHPWPREAEDRVNQLLGQVAAKELECQRLREALNFIATHFSTDWPERCQSNVLTARKVLGA